MHVNTGELITDPKNAKDLPGGKDMYIRNPTDNQKKKAAQNAEIRSKLKMNKGGLKMPTADQVGLKKLPTPVRNKMGYMYGGGMMKKPRMSNMDYRKGGMVIIALDMTKKKGKK